MELDLEGGEVSVSFGSTKVLDGAPIRRGQQGDHFASRPINGGAAEVDVCTSSSVAAERR
jgi:hypothetical protein